MKKILLLFSVIVLGVHSGACLMAQTIEVGGETVVQRVQLTGGSGSALTTPSVDVKMVFDADKEILTVGIVSRTQGSDVVWIPVGGMDRGDMKKYSLHELHMKCKMSRVFKRQVAFGVTAGMVFSNATTIVQPSAVVLFGGDSARYDVKVSNIDKPVVVKLAGLVSARVNEISGSERITYNYVADEVTLTVKLKGDPCRLPENIRLRTMVLRLNEYSDSLGEDLKIAKNRKDVAECRRLKKAFEDSVQVMYNSYMMSIGQTSHICQEIEDLIEFTADNIRIAGMMKCEQSGGGGGTSGGSSSGGGATVATVVKRLRDETHELEVCFDAIKSAQYRGKDYSAEATKARAIIRRTDEFIGSLTGSVSGNEDVKSRRGSYEIMKQRIESRIGKK